METWYPQPWMLPLIVVALVVPPFLGFALGGAALGTALGAATVAALIVIAARTRNRGPIELAAKAQAPLLAVALAPIDDGNVANRIATLAAAEGERAGHAVLVLAPAQPTRAQRWASDDEPGRIAAQERLAVSIATLAASGCHAEGRVVDESPVQAVEDVAAQHGASRVVFVTRPGEDQDPVEEVRERLLRPVDRIEVNADPSSA
jgi:hypothetical protein